jgi:hypothetical protein
MDDLTLGFEEMYGVKISTYLSPGHKGELLRGAYLRLGNQVGIYFDADLSEDWRRYVATKEMCHLILSDSDYFTQDPVTLIELLVYEETTPLDGAAPLDLVSDSMTKLAAVELLFPHEYRDAAKAKLADGSKSIFGLAQDFQIPSHVIGFALSETYSGYCDKARAALT